MSVDRSMRNAFAALLLVAAVFVAMNRIVSSAPLGDWWLALVLGIVGVALLPNWDFSRRSVDRDDAPSLSAPGVQSYSVSEKIVPRLHTMTIRPDPEASEYVVTVTNDATGDVLPFMEAQDIPLSEEVTAAAAELAPLVAEEVIPTSPETPTPNAPAEPTVESPETSMPESVGSADDLTKLNGVGAKSAAALKAAGIDSYNKLANSTDDAIRAALATGGVRLVGDVNTWTQQAAYAARGDWDGLKQFNAGRKATNGD